MKILRLTSENIKRLSAVEITPDGSPVVVIAGENEAGKSSVLDSIAYALGGKDLMPAAPIRKGQEKASVTVDLGDYIVKRTFTPSGGSLTVMNRDGARFPSPQALLDGLIGRLTFDPLAFAEMKPEEQAKTLRALARIDTTDNELARKAAFDQRTLVNRDVAQAQAALAKLPAVHEAIGVEPLSADALTLQLDAADRLADRAAAAARGLSEAKTRQSVARERLAHVRTLVASLQAQLEAAEADEETAAMAATVAEDQLAEAERAQATALAQVPDRAALRQQIGAITEHNRKATENQRRAELAQQLAERTAVAATLTGTIARLDAEKAANLASATFPIAGLGLDEHGVTWQDLPFDQASTSVRIRVSVAIGLALHPKLKVLLIRNGNDLGPTHLAAIAEQAREADAQLWVERIAGGNGLQTVVIEDGAIAGKAVTQ